jgi:uncharacterized ferritin-like protein (DUF455 family)
MKDFTFNIHDRALHALEEKDPQAKCRLTNELYEQWQSGELTRQSATDPRRIEIPGRPDNPKLVAPRKLKKRSVHTKQGHAALIHALCHIEFNAINLGLDAVYRFHGLPDDYYSDWLQVAKEEALHFSLLNDYLLELGFHYGDFPAHNGLWEMALTTDHDVLVRMALVPRVMEARGLDVTPGIIGKFRQVGDLRAIAILDIIQRDEVGHVEIGSRWFRYFCQQRHLMPLDTFKKLLRQYMKGQIRGPFEYQARKCAGFSEDELAYLEQAG